MQVNQLPATPAKRSPLAIQRAVFVALVIRELRSRVQGRWLSLLWMLFEPLAHVLVILALFGFRHHAASPNVEFPVFLITGLLPYFMFRNLARKQASAVIASRSLYAYRQVKPMDALLARTAVEILLYSAVYLSALALLGWLGYHWLPVAPLELAGVSAVLLALGGGLGVLITVATNDRPRIANAIGLLFLPLYLLSGVIFPVRSVPPEYREWLLWNPVLHLIDLSRLYFIPHYEPLPEVNLAYPAACALAVGAFSLSAYRVYRHALMSTP